MHLVTIISDKGADKLGKIITTQTKSFSREGIVIEDEICPNNSLIKYIVNENTIKYYSKNDFIKYFNHQISNAIYMYIKIYEETEIIQNIISSEYNYFNIDERKEILQRSLNSAQKSTQDCEDMQGQRSIIIGELNKYFEANNEINIQGFITFRLKDYLDDLKIIIEESVEDYLMDREYNEFIKLLRYFVDIQEPKVETVHIYMKDENDYSLYDNYGKEIDNEYLRLIAAEMRVNDLNYDDLLISSLITIAPKSIVIHKLGKSNFECIINTITRIFNNKVDLCEGCDWCIIKSNVNKE